MDRNVYPNISTAAFELMQQVRRTVVVRDAVGREHLLYSISKERWLLLETLTFVPFLPQDNDRLVVVKRESETKDKTLFSLLVSTETWKKLR